MLGAVLALASAALFGLNNAATRRGVLTATVLQGMAITVPLGLPVFLMFMPLVGGWAELWGMSGPFAAWMAAAGIVHFVIGRYGNYRATQALGANLSTPVQQLSILVSLVLAVAFLDEEVTGLKLVGLVLVLIGPGIVMARRKQGRARAAAKAMVLDYPAGFVWGTVCALGYGVSPVMIAHAMDGAQSIPLALAGIVVSYAAASVVVAVLVVVAGGRRYLAGTGGGAAGWFVLSAVAVALSQMLRYMALAVAPVSVVTPIQRLSVLFRVLFGAVINRDVEVFDGAVLAGIVLSVAGTVALAAETGFVRDLTGDLWGWGGWLLAAW
ncbi:MAG: EamA family transporter [Rhodobacteraceae bacterium]|jgi:drug/metabolite transporter (DMT)-like permease|nr:EamA family transporter [Paracoccaceae bacterium]